MGKLLVSGDGKKYFINVVSSGLVMLIGSIGGIWITLNADSARGDQKSSLLAMGIIFIVFGVISVIPLLRAVYMTKTNISVFEGGVSGVALEGAFSAKSFSTPYDKIENVDIVKKTAVLIYTSYGKYTCYASNAEEIKNEISKLK